MEPIAPPPRHRVAITILRACLAVPLLFGPLIPVQAQDANHSIASPTPGWPQWRGPRRDGVSLETGLLQEWPAGGPSELWTATGIGKGFGSPIIVGDSVYIAGDVGEDCVVSALDLAGKVKWRATNGRSWKKSQPGARTTCCFASGRLYLMNAHGRLACLDADTGTEVWAADLLEQFGGVNISWGVSESVLVDGNAVFVTPVGSKALMAALDKATGQTLWTTPPLPGEELSYSSAILVSIGGRKQVINCGSQHVFGVDAETGALLWQQPHTIPKWVVAMSPVFYQDSVIVSCATKDEGETVRLRIAAAQPEPLWKVPLGETYAGNVVCVNQEVVGARKGKFKEWLCVDVESGVTKHTLTGMDGGSVLHADNRFYCLTDTGTACLLRSTEQGLAPVGQMQLVQGKKDVWAHPVVCAGRLYLRYHDTLRCFDIRR